MHSFVLSYLLYWKPLGYALAFIGMLFEGDATLFSIAFLTHRGFFDPGDMIVVAFGGVMIGDFLWYVAGARYGAWLFHHPWIARAVAPFDQRLHRAPFQTIFLSKFAYGIHHPLLARAGAIGIPARRFLKIDFAASLLWFSIVGSAGYVSSVSLALARHYLRFTEIALAAALIGFIAIEYFFRRTQTKAQ